MYLSRPPLSYAYPFNWNRPYTFDRTGIPLAPGAFGRNADLYGRVPGRRCHQSRWWFLVRTVSVFFYRMPIGGPSHAPVGNRPDSLPPRRIRSNPFAVRGSLHRVVRDLVISSA